LPRVGEVAEKVLLVLLPAGPDVRDFLKGRISQRSPLSVKKDSTLRFSRRGLVLLLLLLPGGETEREEEAEIECSIVTTLSLA
jgi:hypothetical protein